MRNGEACFISSLPLGVVRLTEGKGTPEAMERKIRKELGALMQEMKGSSCSVDRDTVLIGTAGTATTLAAINLRMEQYDYRLVNNYIIAQDEIQAIYRRLLPLAPDQRLGIPGLERGREDLIIAGSLITLHTMEMFGIGSMKVSDYGLLEGLVVTDELPADPVNSVD